MYRLQSNYRRIHRPYGTIDDVCRLITDLTARDMKLIMDLVVNHTSDQVCRRSQISELRYSIRTGLMKNETA